MGGPVEYFTGSVRVDSRFQGRAPARVGGGIVMFEPGARTAWHTHPLGQTSIVVSGYGWVQVEGEAREEIVLATSSGSLPARNIGMVRP
jgi:quercetin dioxygenase-like cupin family protein